MKLKMLIAMLLSFVLIGGAGHHANAAYTTDYLSSVDKKEKKKKDKKPVAPKPKPAPKPKKAETHWRCATHYHVKGVDDDKVNYFYVEFWGGTEQSNLKKMFAKLPPNYVLDGGAGCVVYSPHDWDE